MGPGIDVVDNDHSFAGGESGGVDGIGGVVETDVDVGKVESGMRPRVLGPAKATGGKGPVPELILEKEVDAGFDGFEDVGGDAGAREVEEAREGEAGGEREEEDMDILFRG